jgi:hypothetical protein
MAHTKIFEERHPKNLTVVAKKKDGGEQEIKLKYTPNQMVGEIRKAVAKELGINADRSH